LAAERASSDRATNSSQALVQRTRSSTSKGAGVSRRCRRACHGGSSGKASPALAVSPDHALAAASLPGPHRDPWDRIMMAQALAERLAVVTVGRQFSDYGIPVLW
jgi:hypothetical protein